MGQAVIDAVIASLGFLEPSAKHALQMYYDDLLRFNRALNLISRADPRRRAAELVGEACLAAATLSINKTEYILDLGSGAGVPGIPTAICVPGARVILLERRARRCEFLRREVLALGLDAVEVVEADASTPGELAGRMDRVLAKAVRRPALVLGLARPFLQADGRVVLYRDARWNPQDAGPGWRLQRQRSLLAPWLRRELAIFEFVSA